MEPRGSELLRRLRCVRHYFLTKSIVSCTLVFSRAAEKSETASCIFDPCSFSGCSDSALEMLHSRRHEKLGGCNSLQRQADILEEVQ